MKVAIVIGRVPMVDSDGEQAEVQNPPPHVRALGSTKFLSPCDAGFHSTRGWTRTTDLRHVLPTLCQLSYPRSCTNPTIGLTAKC